MKIGIDILGGDFAPDATVKGSILAYNELPKDVKLVLIGDKDKIHAICREQNFDPGVFEIVHTTEFIEMGDHPAKAFQHKPKSSIVLGYQMLAKKEINGFASAGSTGAMMVGAMYSIKPVPGIIRPVICSDFPNMSEKHSIFLDVGLNPDAKPEVLYQYAVLGSIYAQTVFGIEKPSVALLSIGSEEEKGNLVSKAVYAMLKTSALNFIGNIEGTDLYYKHAADVIVCDGFAGNILLKATEAFYMLTKKLGLKHEQLEKYNYENFGGTPILGVNDVAVIGHGISNAKAIMNMIKQTYLVAKSNLIEKINTAFI
jgi:phosphate acyltransferase